MAKGNGFTDEHTKTTVINADGGRAEWFACTFTYHRLQVVIEKVDGAGVYIAESADEAVFFKDPAKQAVVLAGCGRASFFFGALMAEVKESGFGRGFAQAVEHGERKGAVFADAVCSYFHDAGIEGVYFVVEKIRVFTSDNTPVFKLTFEHFYACTKKLSFLVVADFKLNQCGLFVGGLTFAVKQHPDLKLFHILVFFGIFFGIFSLYKTTQN